MKFDVGDIRTATAKFLNKNGELATVDLVDRVPTWSVEPIEAAAAVVLGAIEGQPLQRSVSLMAPFGTPDTGWKVVAEGWDTDLDPGEVSEPLRIVSEMNFTVPLEAVAGEIAIT